MFTYLKKLFGFNVDAAPKPALTEVVVPELESTKTAVKSEHIPVESTPVESTPKSVPKQEPVLEVSPPAVEEKPTPAVITPKTRAKKPAKAATPKVDNTVVMPKRTRTKKTADVQQDGIPIVDTDGTWPFPPPVEGAAKTAGKTKKNKK